MTNQSDIQELIFNYGAKNVTSATLNQLTLPAVPSGRSIIYGFEIQQLGPSMIKVTKGAAVKEFVIIKYLEDLTIAVDVSIDTYKFVVLTFNYIEVDDPPKASIQLKDRAELTLESDLILGVIKIDNHVIDSILDYYPPEPDLERELDTMADEKVKDHNNDLNAHPALQQRLEALEQASTFKAIAGENISKYSPVCIIDNQAYIASNAVGNEGRSGVIGIAMESVNAQEELEIQTFGLVENNTWNFSNVGVIPYVYLNGSSISNFIPTSGSVIVVGIVTSSTSFIIAPQFICL